jgi:hypothetical protein
MFGSQPTQGWPHGAFTHGLQVNGADEQMPESSHCPFRLKQVPFGSHTDSVQSAPHGKPTQEVWQLGVVCWHM